MKQGGEDQMSVYVVLFDIPCEGALSGSDWVHAFASYEAAEAWVAAQGDDELGEWVVCEVPLQ